MVREGPAPCLLSYGNAKALGIARVLCEDKVAAISREPFDLSKSDGAADHDAVVKSDTQAFSVARWAGSRTLK